VTWTKLGDEFSDQARDLTDAEHRTHVDALIWSNRRGLDLHIPKRDLPRFAESDAAADAVTGLVVKGWWKDRGDTWHVGVHFPEWQLERAVIEKRREGSALRMRRSRMHKAGEHSICLPERCADVARNETRNETRDPGRCADVARNETRNETRDPGRVGTGTTYPPDPLVQNQDQGQGSGIMPEKAERSGTGVRGRGPRPPEADVKTSRRESAPRVPASVQAIGAGLTPGSAANSQSPRVHHGSDNDGSDAQQQSIPVTHQSQAADRNAREDVSGNGERTRQLDALEAWIRDNPESAP
jgi:hypothetical protein